MTRAVINGGWDDAPHLTEDQKAEMLKSTLPYLREARSKGIPSLGSGAVYPVELKDVLIDPIQIPDFWPKLYGLDVGWNCTAAIFVAIDRDSDIVYVYSEHCKGGAEPPSHASAIKARGHWIPGVIDPAAAGAGQADGKAIVDAYKKHGLNLKFADNAREAGIMEVYQRLCTGRLRIFKTLQKLQWEYGLYRRDLKGKIIKENDHCLDALRYACLGLAHAKTRPVKNTFNGNGFRPANSAAGY